MCVHRSVLLQAGPEVPDRVHMAIAVDVLTVGCVQLAFAGERQERRSSVCTVAPGRKFLPMVGQAPNVGHDPDQHAAVTPHRAEDHGAVPAVAVTGAAAAT